MIRVGLSIHPTLIIENKKTRRYVKWQILLLGKLEL